MLGFKKKKKNVFRQIVKHHFEAEHKKNLLRKLAKEVILHDLPRFEKQINTSSSGGIPRFSWTR